MRRPIIDDALTADGLRTRLNAEVLGRDIFCLDETTSTNVIARERARKGAPDGALVIAEAQTAGKGRQGRKWFSPKGTGIYMSIILRSPFHTRRPEILSLLGAFTTATAIRAEADVRADMKWPNDVILDGKKVAGVLGESGHGGGPPFVILGIGVNVNATAADLPPDLAEVATSLRIECDREFSRTALIASIVDRFEEFYLRAEAEALTDLITAIRPLCSSLDQRVRVKHERELVTGRTVDIDETGALIVETPDEERHRFLGGEVTIL